MGEARTDLPLHARAAVVVPWRPGCPHREAAWAWVRRRYERDGWRVVEGEAPEGPWRKALAAAEAIERTDADTLIVADADVWSDRLLEAVEAAHETGWAVPHSHIHRLTEQATDAVLAGGPLGGKLEEKPYRGVAGGGIVVITRDAWRLVPLDPRFAGWGSEDEAWGLALRRLIGRPWRTDGPLWHLWHPPQPRQSRGIGSDASVALYRRYARACREPDRLRALLEEVRT